MGPGQKIGILINCLEVGGAQKMALQLFDVLDGTGMPTFLFTTDSTDTMSVHPDAARAEYLAKKIIPLSSMDINRPTLQKILAAPVQYNRLLRYIRKLGLDTLISFEDRANIFNLLSVSVKYRIISIRHPMKSVLLVKAPVKRHLISLFFTLFIRRADRINFNSRESMREFRELFTVPCRRLSVIYNFCDHQILERRKTDPSAMQGYPGLSSSGYIIACGRFKPVKGFAGLLRAFADFASKKPDIPLVLLGDGPLRKELQTMAVGLGIADRVIFPGFRENTAPWIAGAEVFVLTSQSEGFPNVLLEAMALETAVVSVDCSAGPREILSPSSDCTARAEKIEWAEYGILVPPLNKLAPTPEEPLTIREKCLADAMERVLQNPETRQRYQRAGYQRSLDFGGQHLHKEWMNLIANG